MTKGKLSIEDMTHLFQLLGNRTRLLIITLLGERSCCVCELVGVLNISQPAVSQHLRKLRDAQVVLEKRRGKWIYYSLNKTSKSYPLLEDILTFSPHPTDLLEKMDHINKELC